MVARRDVSQDIFVARQKSWSLRNVGQAILRALSTTNNRSVLNILYWQLASLLLPNCYFLLLYFLSILRSVVWKWTVCLLSREFASITRLSLTHFRQGFFFAKQLFLLSYEIPARTNWNNSNVVLRKKIRKWKTGFVFKPDIRFPGRLQNAYVSFAVFNDYYFLRKLVSRRRRFHISSFPRPSRKPAFSWMRLAW